MTGTALARYHVDTRRRPKDPHHVSHDPRSQGERAALMCAEAVPWRCHRSLIADGLVVHGIPVVHILTDKRTQAPTLKPWARVEGTRITYRPADQETERDVQGP